MEINGTNPLIGLNNKVERLDALAQQDRTPETGRNTSDSDRLELSMRSLEIAHLEGLIQSTPDVREARIEQVRREIESGTYNVKAEQIADRIIGGNLLDEVI